MKAASSEHLEVARAMLERMLLMTRGLSHAPLVEIGGRLREAMMQLDAMRAQPTAAHLEQLPGLGASLGRLREAIEQAGEAQLGSVLGGIDRALAEHRARLAQAIAWPAAAPPAPPAEFRASTTAPQTRVASGPIAFHVPAGERPAFRIPQPPELSLSALFEEALADEATSDDSMPVLGIAQPEPDPMPERSKLVVLRGSVDRRGAERACLEDLARQCLGSIGSLGPLRRCDLDEVWTDQQASFDRRLLESLDAFFAFGVPSPGTPHVDVAALAQAHLREAVVPDPFRAFAHALVLACLEGESGARAAGLALRTAPPSTLAAHVEALALAPGPAVDTVMREIACEEHDPAVLAAALEVLVRRRAPEVPEALLLLQHADHRVRAAAARCLAHGSKPAAAEHLAALADEERDGEVLVAALEGLLLVDTPCALTRLRQRLRAELDAPGTLARAARTALGYLLAAVGDREDAPLLQAMVAQRPGEAEILGWHGDPRAFEALLRALESTPEPAARGLSILVGTRRSGAARWSRPSTAASDWQSTWDATKKTRDQRLRFGLPFDPRLDVQELRAWGVPQRARAHMAYELALAGAIWIDVFDWCGRQQQALDRIEAAL